MAPAPTSLVAWFPADLPRDAGATPTRDRLHGRQPQPRRPAPRHRAPLLLRDFTRLPRPRRSPAGTQPIFGPKPHFGIGDSPPLAIASSVSRERRVIGYGGIAQTW